MISVLTETFLSHQTTKFNKQISKTVVEIIEKTPLAIAAHRILILQEINWIKKNMVAQPFITF